MKRNEENIGTESSRNSQRKDRRKDNRYSRKYERSYLGVAPEIQSYGLAKWELLIELKFLLKLEVLIS